MLRIRSTTHDSFAASRFLRRFDDVRPIAALPSPTALSGRHGSGSLSLPPNPGTSRSTSCSARAAGKRAAGRRASRASVPPSRATSERALSRVYASPRRLSGRPFAGRCARWRERLRVSPVCIRSCASRCARCCIALCVSRCSQFCARDGRIGRALPRGFTFRVDLVVDLDAV